MTKRITKATFKSFIRNNDDLYIKVKSRFDGMIDGSRSNPDAEFIPVQDTDRDHNYTMGIAGVWIVPNSRNSFSAYEDENFIGISVYNSCRTFILAKRK